MVMACWQGYYWLLSGALIVWKENSTVGRPDYGLISWFPGFLSDHVNLPMAFLGCRVAIQPVWPRKWSVELAFRCRYDYEGRDECAGLRPRPAFGVVGAGIGLAVGTGFYLAGGVVTIIAVLVLALLDDGEKFIGKQTGKDSSNTADRPGAPRLSVKFLNTNGVSISNFNFRYRRGKTKGDYLYK